MNDEMKRRTFLSAIVGTLIGVPIAVRLLSGGKPGSKETHYFSKTLKKYQTMLEVPIASLGASSPVALRMNPAAGSRWNYVIFSKSFLPNEFSRAVGDDPDTFLLREGNIHFSRTANDQDVFTGGDSFSQLCSPFGKEDRTLAEIAVLLRNGTLVPAQVKDAGPKGYDTQFERILALQQQVPKELTLGTRWRGTTGRLKPFEGFTTDYEVAGFDSVGDRPTVRIGFAAKIPNIAGLPGITAHKMAANAVMTNEHRGNAWFDLETGMLVRQEIEMDTACSAPELLAPKGNPKSDTDSEKLLHVKANVVVHLFNT